MQTSPYSDLIAEKIDEWQKKLNKIEERAATASPENKEKLTGTLAELRAAVDSATTELYALDKQETVENTVEIKNKILQVFNSIDRNLVEAEESSPYML